MICARCQQPFEPYARAGFVVICGGCGETLIVAEDGATRKALGTDIDRLPPDAVKQLRAARTSLRKSRRGDAA